MKTSKIMSVIAPTACLFAATVTAPQKAAAQEYYLGQILLVGFNFCPRGTAQAEGQLLPISQNTALFSLYGTIYGGDGRTTFALPDLRGRSPVGDGNGPGLEPRSLGQRGGANQQTLAVAQMPSHNHPVNATNADGAWPGPDGKILAADPSETPDETIYSTEPPNKVMNDVMIGHVGGNQPHSINDPYLTLRYCVVMQGIYPSRS